MQQEPRWEQPKEAQHISYSVYGQKWKVEFTTNCELQHFSM